MSVASLIFLVDTLEKRIVAESKGPRGCSTMA